MFSSKIISCTCDLHLKLDIKNPLNITFFIKWFKKWVVCLVALSFKILRFKIFCMIWFFIKFIQWTCIFIKGGHVFVAQKVWNRLYDFMPSIWILKKEKHFEHLIILVYKIQNDTYIVFKLFKNIFINLRRHHFIYWHTTIHYNYNNVI